jgi:histidyl-tRNA synthetase
MITENVSDEANRVKILDLMGTEKIEEIGSVIKMGPEAEEAVDELLRLFELLDTMGVGKFCRFDIGVVRGLAYYTGAVFEIYAIGGELRAIGGGGRYDNLLGDFGGPQITGTGFGMGDCVLEILLREKGLLEDAPTTRSLDDFVVCIDSEFMTKAVEITARLRMGGVASEFSYKGGNLKKQLKEASSANAKRCIIIGQEYDKGELVVKDMATGEQETVSEEKFWAELEGRKG